jgi:hypothetical protein
MMIGDDVRVVLYSTPKGSASARRAPIEDDHHTKKEVVKPGIDRWIPTRHKGGQRE